MFRCAEKFRHYTRTYFRRSSAVKQVTLLRKVSDIPSTEREIIKVKLPLAGQGYSAKDNTRKERRQQQVGFMYFKL